MTSTDVWCSRPGELAGGCEERLTLVLTAAAALVVVGHHKANSFVNS
jgi:hypothetical protein